MRSSNPALSDNAFLADRSVSPSGTMTISGTVNKTAILLGLVVISALFMWNKVYGLENPAAYFPWLIGSSIAGLVIAMITIFKKTVAPITAPLYALVEGVVVGVLSAFFETIYPGIVFQATLLTFGTLLRVG